MTSNSPASIPADTPASAPASAGLDGQAPSPAFQQSWADLHSQAVTVLTAACRLRRPNPHADGTTTPGEPIDFADFLASVLAGVAANVGSIDRVTAGRPGSWEADLVGQLLTGTVGADEVWLYEHRTEPVVVPLNVPELVWDLPGFPDYETALDAALAPFYVVTDPDHPDNLAGVDLSDEQWGALEAATQTTEATVLAAYTRLYQQYAEAFTAAVHAAAAQIPVLAAAGITVTVTTITDPTTTGAQATGVVNPVDELTHGPSDDALVTRLWNAAAAAVPIPTPPVIPTIPGGPS